MRNENRWPINLKKSFHSNLSPGKIRLSRFLLWELLNEWLYTKDSSPTCPSHGRMDSDIIHTPFYSTLPISIHYGDLFRHWSALLWVHDLRAGVVFSRLTCILQESQKFLVLWDWKNLSSGLWPWPWIIKLNKDPRSKLTGYSDECQSDPLKR
jgi:hypothetical protein